VLFKLGAFDKKFVLDQIYNELTFIHIDEKKLDDKGAEFKMIFSVSETEYKVLSFNSRALDQAKVNILYTAPESVAHTFYCPISNQMLIVLANDQNDMVTVKLNSNFQVDKSLPV
jgi:hypothetical protein